MPTINSTKSKLPGLNTPGVKVIWSAMATGDAGDGVEVPVNLKARSVQVEGTFSGSTVTLQGSNDNTNWYALKDMAGNDVAFTAAGLKNITTLSLYVRPSAAAGTGSAFVVTLIAN